MEHFASAEVAGVAGATNVGDVAPLEMVPSGSSAGVMDLIAGVADVANAANAADLEKWKCDAAEKAANVEKVVGEDAARYEVVGVVVMNVQPVESSRVYPSPHQH